jgi:hypothetical protein
MLGAPARSVKRRSRDASRQSRRRYSLAMSAVLRPLSPAICSSRIEARTWRSMPCQT